MSEYPKWLRAPGQPATRVQNAGAEAEQLKAWAAFEQSLPPAVAHDIKQVAADDLPALRIAYKAKFGKRAFPGWNAAEVKARIEATE